MSATAIVSRRVAIVMQLQRPVQFEITEQTRESLSSWIDLAGRRSDDYLFPSRIHGSPHVSTRQYARIVRNWVRPRFKRLRYSYYAAHEGLFDLQANQEPPRCAILGHTKLESTVRYLGIEVDDALEMAEQTEV